MDDNFELSAFNPRQNPAMTAKILRHAVEIVAKGNPAFVDHFLEALNDGAVKAVFENFSELPEDELEKIKHIFANKLLAANGLIY